MRFWSGSGAGKTTLLNVLTGIGRPTGEVRLHSKRTPWVLGGSAETSKASSGQQNQNISISLLFFFRASDSLQRCAAAQRLYRNVRRHSPGTEVGRIWGHAATHHSQTCSNYREFLTPPPRIHCACRKTRCTER